MDGFHANDDQLLDLLVDGELEESQRRALLAWCEREPDGWRRCASAFLEAQCWGREFESMAASEGRADGFQSEIRNPQSTIASTPASRRDTRAAGRLRAPRSFLSPLAMAASFLLALTLGMLIRGGGLATQDGRLATQDGLADQAPIGVGGEPSDELAAGSRDAADGRVPRPLDNVRLVWDGPEGTTEAIELPVVEGATLDENWLRSQPSALPADLLQALQRSGHRVRQRRELVPLNMQDGRRLVVPVDQVDVHPVGNRQVYQ
ncbi:MAG TPA: hypothetical protein VMV69_05450 [Pirellulales bacterium]|nr:hypothetical protein [Pirellulales bacterium]